jgi:hypothetical protein
MNSINISFHFDSGKERDQWIIKKKKFNNHKIEEDLL